MVTTLSSETTQDAQRNSTAKSPASAISEPASIHDSGALTLVPLDLIDEPAQAVRATFDEVQLAELATSINDMGLIQPIIVKRAGERFEVIAGHRRLVACRIAELSPVPCLVREPGAVDPNAVKVAENYYREPVNPAEEAEFLQVLLDTQCGGDTDNLAALIKHSRSYVEDRLLLKRSDPEVLKALGRRDISLTVARELNRVKDSDLRLVYLHAAIRGGATASVIRNWRRDEVPNFSSTESGDAVIAAAQTSAAAFQQAPMRCLFCGDTDEPERIEHLWLHKHCRKYVEKMLNVAAASEPAPEGSDSGR
jgi:ParB family transcriptional regulator, chromosome partitioning protein